MSDIVRTIDLQKRFGGTVVLDGLSMAVPEGAIYGLVGPNWSG
jgi:ABC-type branched-subunit amino acid transport system ATPase component